MVLNLPSATSQKKALILLWDFGLQKLRKERSLTQIGLVNKVQKARENVLDDLRVEIKTLLSQKPEEVEKSYKMD